jgi:very-short-patch-repair endonuclease
MTGPYIRYRKDLTQRAQSLRRDPTPAEKKLWHEFLADLPEKFTRQKPLGRYIADFYCSRHKLVVELDGDSHYSGSAQRYDAVRTEMLGREGVRVIRFANPDILENFSEVCAAILRELRQS